ncbi:MAG: hypothetical protein ACFFEF_18210 [Candidatus Thorarchaeota archaeon]
MSSEQNRHEEHQRSDEYWMGVRDALRMVDSFIKWAKTNRERAKTLEEFLHEGLIAAAKRCESCLSKQLGVKFASDEPLPDIDSVEETGPSETAPTEPIEPEESLEAAPPEIVLEPEGSEEFEEIPIVVDIVPEYEAPKDSFDDAAISIESIGSSEGSILDESLDTGEPREFKDDFSLSEPDSLFVEPVPDGIDVTESEEESESDLADITIEDDKEEEEPIPIEEDEDVLVDDSEISPSKAESELPYPPSFIEPPAPEFPKEEEAHDYPSERARIWSSTDERQPSELIQDEESVDFKDTETVKSPPPPPPPPVDDEESEEERRRRARRLFFGT